MQLGAHLKPYPQNWCGIISGFLSNTNDKDSKQHPQLIGKTSSGTCLIPNHTGANPS